ncbi:MAG: FG-GAP repeat protein, partial [Dokdonella sp.]
MPYLERSAVAPAAARSGLFWLMIILSSWSGTSSAGMATASAAPGVTAPSATAAATIVSEAALPEELSRSEWQSIRAAYEANRHAVQRSVKQPGSYRARNPGQQWLSAFNEGGVTITPDHGRWKFGLRLARWGDAGQEQQTALLDGIDAHGQRTVYRYSDGLEEWFVNDQRGLQHGFTVHQAPPGNGDSLRFSLDIAGELTPRVAANGRDVALLDTHGKPALDYNHLQVQDADGRTLAAHFASRGKRLVLSIDAGSARYPITIDPVLQQQAYMKAGNTDGGDLFGNSVAIAGDTVVVGAPREDSNAIGVNGNQSDNSATDSGAAYVFVRDGAGNWLQQAYLKASNTGGGDLFGKSVAISGDTIVIGASLEASDANGVDGNPNDNSASQAGAAYVFVRDGAGHWAQQAYLKSSNSESGDFFGSSVGIAGNIVVVGAVGEASSATGVNGNQTDNSATFAGAAYVFVRTGSGTWSQQAYLKASNTGNFDIFGTSVAISGDTVVIGAEREDSIATGVNGNQSDNSAAEAGAAYVFVRDGAGNWSQNAYLKSSNTGAGDSFGKSVAISGDTVVIGASLEASNASGVNGDQSDNSASQAGAAYVFVRDGAGNWAQQAYLKASNTDAGDLFGESVAVSGNTVLVGARAEDSNATGVNGNQTSNAADDAGAAYVFVRDGTGAWTQQAYLKASNTDAGDEFGTSVAIAGDTVLVSARFEDSNATGVDGGQSDNSAADAGALYVFDVAFTVGGTVTGLSGSGLVLRNNGGDDLAIAANGAFTFATPLTDGSTYAVTVLAQPGGPSQTCTVANASGTLKGANVSNVAITCATSQYTVGGTISGLNGNHLLLQNNAGGFLVATGNGPFTFPTALADGSSYTVTAKVIAQPGAPSQTCTVSNGSGTLAGANVSNVIIDCQSIGIDITPRRLDFVVIPLGQSSPAQMVVIENTGEIAFAVQTITLTGAASAD